jgi:D-alanyl-D-alanine carboxypeptidase/D-alanyl-D-alanine-endopeptidase (penicillin-binding protein 4)
VPQGGNAATSAVHPGFDTPMGRIVCLATLFVALLAPAAQAGGPAATVQMLDRQMNKAGGASGALVVDLDTGATLYSRAPDVPRIPASVNKLYTTSAALERYGAEGQLDTVVLGDAPLEAGVLDGNLYLRGGGDPSFSRAEASGFARVLAGSGLTEITGRVVGDESHFDSLRGGPDSGYGVSTWVGPLSGLPFNHGFTLAKRPRFQRKPPLFAAQVFTRELKRAGVTVRRAARAGVAPESAVLLGEWASPRMSVLVRHTNRPSDNYMAETLLKALGADFGGGGTTAAGSAVARTHAAEFGALPTIVDGSGLSRLNRTTPRDVVELLVGMDQSELAEPMLISLSVAGQSGTLAKRMRGTAAQGRCRAKTGTLNGVSNLAGYCRSKSGARTAFAILMSGVNVWGAHPLQNKMAAALARYRP